MNYSSVPQLPKALVPQGSQHFHPSPLKLFWGGTFPASVAKGRAQCLSWFLFTAFLLNFFSCSGKLVLGYPLTLTPFFAQLHLFTFLTAALVSDCEITISQEI